MWERDLIPGYEEEEASERIDRAIAFIGLPEKICGLECVPLTPRKLEYLRAYSNPVICGGRIDSASIEQFLWIVSPLFAPFKPEVLAAFVDSLSGVDFTKAHHELDEYLDRAFLDAPHGPADKSHYSIAAYHVFAMASDPFRWDMERTMDTPLSILYQLQKCKDKHAGCVVVNRRSDAVAGDWLSELQVITEPTVDKLKRRIDELRKEGMEIVSNMSPNAAKETAEDGTVTVKLGTVVSWSVAMMKGGPVSGE